MVSLNTYKRLLLKYADSKEIVCGILMCATTELELDEFLKCIDELVESGHEEYKSPDILREMEAD